MPVRSRSRFSISATEPAPPSITSRTRSISRSAPLRIMPPSRTEKGGSSTKALRIISRQSRMMSMRFMSF